MSTFTAIKAVGTNKITVFFLGIVLLAISSKVAIPFYPVPMTLQTLVIYLIAGSLPTQAPEEELSSAVGPPKVLASWCAAS